MLNLSEYQKRPKALADYLPWAAIIAPGVVLNKDGSFQRSLEFRGPDLGSSTEEELVAVCARLNNTLRRFDSGWAIYAEAARMPAGLYPETKFEIAASWIVDQERKAAFEEVGHYHESRYYLTLAFMPPADKTSRAAKLVIETPQDDSDEAALDHLARFISETDRVLGMLEGIMPEARFLSDGETLAYLHSTISTKSQEVHVPETPAFIDVLIGDCDLVGGLSPRLGEETLYVLTVKGFPAETTPGIFDQLNALGFSYRWMTRYLPLGKSEAAKLITKTRRQWFAKRKSVAALLKESLFNESTALVDTDADNKALDADAALQDLGGDYVGYGYLTTSIVVSHVDPKIAENQLRAIERIINSAGFVTIHESVGAVDAWLGSLPGNPYANVRLPLISSLNLSHIMPLSAVWAGPKTNTHLEGPPLLMGATEGHTPFRLVTHHGDVGHTLVVGPTGAGKSVLLSLMAMQFQKYENAQVFIFDKGRSARAATLAMEGAHHDLGNSDALSFQPLKDIDDEGSKSWALDWVCALLTHEGVEITPDIKETVWSALESLASSPVKQRTLTGLKALIQDKKLRTALTPYTLDGAFGHLLDGDMESLSDKRVQCFEMETLMERPALVLPVLTYLFHRLEERFDGSPSLLILDEAWLFLDDPLFAARIREWLKTLRKKNVSVIFATQSLADIASSSIAPALIESCPSRIFLPNPRALEPGQQKFYNEFGLNKTQVSILAASTPKRDYYFQSRAGNRLFDLRLGPVALVFCGAGSSEDHIRIDAALEDASDESFASIWLSQNGLDWAADLIVQTCSNDKVLTQEEYVPWLDAAE